MQFGRELNACYDKDMPQIQHYCGVQNPGTSQHRVALLKDIVGGGVLDCRSHLLFTSIFIFRTDGPKAMFWAQVMCLKRA